MMAAMEAHAERRVVGKEVVTHFFMQAGDGTFMIMLAGLLNHEMCFKGFLTTYVVSWNAMLI